MNPSPKVAIITGATSGIGRAAALQLARRGWRVVLLGRNHAAGEKLAATINRGSSFPQATFLRMDLAEPAEVRRAAAAIVQEFPVIDVLIANAGARFDQYRVNSAGWELTFATNHIGHFLLTGLLLNNLLAASQPRMISVSSGAHSSISAVTEWQATAANYDRKRAYAQSKLANVLFSYELARRLSSTPARVNAVDPGGVATRLGLNNGLVPWAKHIIYHTLKREITLPSAAARTLTFLACVPESDAVTGGFFRDCTPVQSSPLSHDRALAASLWEESVGLAAFDASLGEGWSYLKPELSAAR